MPSSLWGPRITLSFRRIDKALTDIVALIDAPSPNDEAMKYHALGIF